MKLVLDKVLQDVKCYEHSHDFFSRIHYDFSIIFRYIEYHKIKEKKSLFQSSSLLSFCSSEWIFWKIIRKQTYFPNEIRGH